MCASFCPRYEDEINKRTAAENEFVGLKKVGKLGQAGQGSLPDAVPMRDGRVSCLGHSDPMCVGFAFSLTFLEMRCLVREAAPSTLLMGKTSYNVTVTSKLISNVN